MKTKHIGSAGIGLIALAGHASAEMVGYEKYTYDAAGNIVARQIGDKVTHFVYAGNTLKTNSRGTTFQHDHIGRLIAESSEGGVERKLSHQFGDKVTGGEVDSTTTEFFYNAEGILVGKKACEVTETFAWDDLGLLMRGQQIFTVWSAVVVFG